jgi:hypothetical protein
VGPFDLGNNIGHPILDGTMHDELKEAIAKIQQAAKENHKSSGIYSTSGDQARGFADQGFNMVFFVENSVSLEADRIPSPGTCDDRHGRAPNIYDIFLDRCQRLLCAFSTERGQRSNVRASQYSRAIGAIAGVSKGIVDCNFHEMVDIAQAPHECPSASSINFSTCSSSNLCMTFRASVAMSGFE